MGAISVRPATPDDLPWIVSQLPEYSDGYTPNGKQLFTDADTASAQLSTFMDTGNVLLVAHDGGTLVGFMAGLLTPHFMNPGIKVLAHLLWWVPKMFRNTRAAALLLKEFSRIGYERADITSLNLQKQAIIKDASLRRYGFVPHEVTYLMEAAQCQP